MILVVGPNTPASLLMGSSPRVSSSAASSADNSNININNDNETNSHEEDDEEEEDSSKEEEEETTTRTINRPSEDPMADRIAALDHAMSEFARRDMEEGGDSDDQDDDDDDEDDDDDDHEEEEEDDDEEEDEDFAHRVLESVLQSYNHAQDSECEDDEDGFVGRSTTSNTAPPRPVPSMRHGGCINTASWMDCGWNISLSAGCSSRVAGRTEECPTQLVTSGDDLLVKFWDVSQTMGMTSPLSGGMATICPFSAPDCSQDTESLRNSWKQYYSTTHSNVISGSVIPLATLSTGHMNNIFHVTPLKGQPGKVATCGADGFLRLSDLETGNSRVVVSPENGDDLGGLFPSGLMNWRPPMCFSHHFLSRNTGLLCTERGLRRFDLRLPPREQSVQNLLGGTLRGCKACAIWSLSKSNTSLEEGDSAYIFGKQSEYRISKRRRPDKILNVAHHLFSTFTFVSGWIISRGCSL